MVTNNAAVPFILVVEDDGDHAMLIQLAFEDARQAHLLEFVGTLHDAREAIVRQLPCLVLTDYRLPDGDGGELVEMAGGEFPVVMMTSHGNEQVAVDAMKAGVQDYIVKSPETFTSMPRIAQRAIREWTLIQERRQAEEDVRRGKREWEKTFDAVPDLISIIDTNHVIVRANRAMAERCGLRPEQFVGRKCHELVHGMKEPPAYCPHVRQVEEGWDQIVEVEEQHLKGIFEITVSPLFDAEGRITAWVHVARDITERKKHEEEARRVEHQFQQTQKLESLGVLAGGIAHDFNNIMTIILGHCHMLKENARFQITPEMCIEHIEIASNRAADLCRQMLAYAGKRCLVQTQVDIRLLIDEIVKLLRSAFKKNVTIAFDSKHDVPEIKGDSSQIQQVAMNLIINAAEAIGASNGTILVTLAMVTVVSDQQIADFLGNPIPTGRYVCLEVSDNGCGMDEKTLKRIFEPFYTTKSTGRGLGMTAILGIVKTHDGALQLSSKTGLGTTFKVYFPDPDQREAVNVISPEKPLPSAKARATVLLVDDEEALLTIGSALLSAMGFTAITASNGREALEIYREGGSRIDIALLDFIMPEMDGIELYQELRKTSPTIPVVICSGYSVEGILEITANDEHARVILKPYNPVQLQNVMLNLLGLDIREPVAGIY